MTSVRTTALLLSFGLSGFAQRSSGPAAGILVVDGGGTSKAVVQEFVRLAGGAQARIVVFPTGASSLRFGAENTILNPDWPRDRPEWLAYEKHLRQMFTVDSVTVLHTRDRAVADSDAFTWARELRPRSKLCSTVAE
jgi:hypothetical protein